MPHINPHPSAAASISTNQISPLFATVGCSQGPVHTECPGRQQHAGQGVQLQQQKSRESEIDLPQY